MHRIYMLCLSLLLVAGVGKAQLLSSKTWRGDTGKVYLRVNPSGLIDVYDGNATIGGEVRLNRTWSVTMDAGFIFYSEYIAEAKKTRGILLRPGIRLYAGKYRDMFIDLQFHYKEVRYHINDWLGKDVVNTVAAYEAFKVFQDRKRVVGGHIMIGGKEFLSKNRRLLLEVYLGFGLHYKEEGLYHEESNSQYDRGFGIYRASNISPEKRTSIAPALPGGLRLLYMIR